RGRDGAGAQDLRRAAKGPDRPPPLHVERERLLLRAGAEGLCLEPRPPRDAAGIRAGRAIAARRHDPAPLPREVAEQDRARVDLRDARWEARAVHGGGGGVAVTPSVSEGPGGMGGATPARPGAS